MPFGVDQDLYLSPSFQDLLCDRTMQGRPTGWFKSLRDYCYRKEWELYDLVHDPQETNIAEAPSYLEIFMQLKEKLLTWQKVTNDPWVCAPDGVWENKGKFSPNGVCMPLQNGI